MEIDNSRTWVIFYLISFVVLLFAFFLTTQGLLLGIGLTLVIVVVGFNLFFILGEIKRNDRKKELMKKLLIREDDEPENPK